MNEGLTDRRLAPSARCRTPHLDREPGPRVGPPLFGGGYGNAQCGGGFLETQADEKAQLDQFRLSFIHQGQFLQRLVHGEQPVVVRERKGNVEPSQIDHLDTGTAFGGQSSSGVFDQDAAHRLGRRTEEMRTILKGGGVAATQAHPGLVDEGGRLECMAGGLAGHLLSRQTAKFLVNDGEEFCGSSGIAAFHTFQDLRKLAQASGGSQARYSGLILSSPASDSAIRKLRRDSWNPIRPTFARPFPAEIVEMVRDASEMSVSCLSRIAMVHAVSAKIEVRIPEGKGGCRHVIPTRCPGS